MSASLSAVDRFLRRKLSAEQYGRVRTFEPVIVTDTEVGGGG